MDAICDNLCILFIFGIAVVLWHACFVAWIEILTRGRVSPWMWTDCKLGYFLFYFGRHYSSMLLVLMSVEKCFAVYFPLKSKTVCTVRTAKWATGIVGIAQAAFNVISFFLESDFIESLYQYRCSYNFDPSVIFILNTVNSVLYSFGPFAFMFITNFAIVLKFMRAKCKRNSTESTNQALAKSATRGTAMVVTVSVTFLILTTPTAVNLVLWHNIKISYNPLYRAFMIFTQYLNHSINGVLYCIVGSRFRNELLKLLFCRKETPDAMSLSHSVNNTGLSGISESIG